MSAVGSKVRIYDLAKELKQDTKRIIEELRREGLDVDVPSNSVPKELADKIRHKYFPKKESAPARAIKVIKKEKPVESDEITPIEPPVIEIPVVEIEEKKEEKIETPIIEKVEEVKPKTIVKEIKIKKPIVVETQPEEPQEKPQEEPPVEVKVEPKVKVKELKLSEKPIIVEPEETKIVEEVIQEEVVISQEVETVVEKEEVIPVAEVVAEVVEQPKVAETTVKVFKPTGTQIKQLKFTKAALQSGFKEGERIVVEKAPVQRIERTTEKAKDRRGGRNQTDVKRPDSRRKTEFRGTPGETATPQTVYVPPADSRKKFGRNQGKKGDKRHDNQNSKFQEREFDYQRPRTIEERILDQVGSVDAGSLKSARLIEGATVRDFAEKIGVVPKDVVQLLVKQGVFATLNQPIGEKLAKDLGKKFGYEVVFVPFEEMVVEEEFEELIATDGDDLEIPRPPVVTVMGHVDHGKTSLLDGIRSANVAEGEAGGITQHIGAYSVYVSNPDTPDEKRRVVFLDTPGHEAFTMMRARGAKATDVVILVVAADDGVMPQTIEAIEHSKAAGVPIIVAINKIDKPEANLDKVKQGLATHGLQPQDWGGDIEMIPVSAKKQQNIDTLLETVLLQADIMELKASETRRASGVVLEAKLDKGRGSVATVLVQQGTLRVGDPFIVGQVHGKVRAMFSDRGEIVTEAPPATPVEVLGLQGVPQAGDAFQVVADLDSAVSIANQRQLKARQAALVKTTKRGIESLGQTEIKELLVVLKADVQGSVEVLKATLEKLSTEKVKVRV
ncbi:MAG: translation initiation factor IF-2, partial [Pyrinomonadaceae bacterium]|nr:translation initiation factor IF-2 [Pyrinomonadaceae bacterium]